MHTMPAPHQPAPSSYDPHDDDSRTGLYAGLSVAALLLLLAMVGSVVMVSRAVADPASASSPVHSTASVPAPSVSLPSAVTPGSVPASTVPSAPSTSVAPSGNGKATGGSPAPQAPTAPKPPATNPPAPSAVITSFSTPDSIDCHNGNFQEFTASWTTKNAVKVTISIDGPGIYKTYGPNGSDSLPFSCSTPHTYLLTAHGADGKVVTRSITLQPRNVPPVDNGGDE